MIGKKVIDNEPIPAIKVREILEEFREDHDLNYEQNITTDYIAKFEHFSVEDSESIIEELQAMDIKTKIAVRIVDLVPKDLSDLRLIFAKENVPIKKEDMEKILSILEKYDVE